MKIILSITITIFILTACAEISETESDFDNNCYSTHATVSDSIEKSNLSYLTEQTDNNLISIEVPVFDIKNFDMIENDIINYIKNYLYDITNVNFSLLQSCSDFLQASEMDVSEIVAKYDYYIDIDCQISIQNEECISIIFEGMINKNTAAHPLNVFFTYNINPETGDRILFSDKYRIDNNLYDIILSCIKDNIASDFNNDIVVETLLDEKTFYDELSSEKSVFCYYTEEYIGISVPVLFSMGSHLELEIPYDNIKLNTDY